MTRNIYLGGNIMRPLEATEGLSGTNALLAFGRANHQLRNVVERTAFSERANLLAQEIQLRQPDLIGLQEVAMWRRGTMELGAIGVSNATTVTGDWLAVLRRRLSDLGLDYNVVHTQVESDVEGPAWVSNPGDGTGRDLRLTMRDVLLKRADPAIKITNRGGGNYASRVVFNLSGVDFAFIRGYNWADVRVDGENFRFINTHLESISSSTALEQVQELIAGPANVPGRDVIAVGDFNSDPLDHSTKPDDEPPTPHSAPYEEITGPGGFFDTWLQHAPASEGYTSGLNEYANNADLSTIDHRIDFVFAKPKAGFGVTVNNAWVVGRDAQTPAGLWASDHMGVAVELVPGAPPAG